MFGIWRYLVRHASVETADRIESELYATFESLARDPGQGHRRSDLTPKELHFYSVYEWMIVYRKDTPLSIVRVIHAKRNARRLLRGET